MATRLYLTADRMMLSKPGFNASPALADQNKIFDSEWGYAGLVGEIVYFDDPAPTAAGELFLTSDNSLVTIPFSRTYPIIPSVIQSFCYTHEPGAAYGGGVFTEPFVKANEEGGDFPPIRWRVYNNRVTFQRVAKISPDFYFRYSEPVMLMVFAW